MRIAFTTLGCRLNQFETEGMSHRVRTGLPEASVVDWNTAADVYVINSCAVTGRAEQKCRQLARAVKRSRPESRVVVVGCYPQLGTERLAGFPEIDAILGNEEKRRIEEYLPAVLAGEPVRAVGRFRRGQAMAAEWIEEFGTHSRATVKVQEGCDMRCSFCAIWRARGPSRSRPPREVVEQVQRLAAAGYEEVVLAGVHLGHYGRDLERPTDLHDLLDMLLELVDERVRIRLSSIDPSEVDEALVRRLVEDPRLCRYLHLPLQSGSDSVLRRMRRAYDVQTYARLVRALANADPDFGLGADLIVGFPGETETEFEETLALLEELPVRFFHVFRYSDREATAAQRMGPKVPGAVAAQRSERLRRLGQRKKQEFLARHVGRVYDAVIEAEGEDPDGPRTALLDDYTDVRVDEGIPRRRVRVRVDAVVEGQALGRVVVASAGACHSGEAA